MKSLKHRFILNKIGDAHLKSLENYLTKTKCQEMLDRQKAGNEVVLFSPYEIPKGLSKHGVKLTVFTEI